MGLFEREKDPVFLKESSDAKRQLDVLKELAPKLNAEGQKKINQDIRLLEYGIQGEDQIAFELKNSHVPMYIIHDIYLEVGDLNAQIDYLVFTKKLCFVLECKNLYGNIEINSSGDFIRTVENNGRWKKEGIYSPITQNERHMELLRKLVTDNRGNFITRKLSSHFFDGSFKSLIVLANPKTVLNARYAKKETKEKVIRADQLIPYIKNQLQLSKDMNYSDSEMRTWAESFLKHHKAAEKDYTEKYQKYLLPEYTVQELPEAEEAAVSQLASEPVSAEPSAADTTAETAVPAENTSPDLQPPADNQKPKDQIEICPRCGAPLVLRTAKKGNYAGGQFLGCTAYPKCRYIRNL